MNLFRELKILPFVSSRHMSPVTACCSVLKAETGGPGRVGREISRQGEGIFVLVARSSCDIRWQLVTAMQH